MSEVIGTDELHFQLQRALGLDMEVSFRPASAMHGILIVAERRNHPSGVVVRSAKIVANTMLRCATDPADLMASSLDEAITDILEVQA